MTSHRKDDEWDIMMRFPDDFLPVLQPAGYGWNGLLFWVTGVQYMHDSVQSGSALPEIIL
jgi:hypothetical protein